MNIHELIEVVKESALIVNKHFGTGFLEEVYKNALVVELRSRGIKAEPERELLIYYKNEIVGKYRSDILVDDRLIIETKSIEALSKVHSMQLVNYLCATKLDVGLLINFGFNFQLRTKTRIHRDPRFQYMKFSIDSHKAYNESTE